jgi:hypothetical protein
MTINEDKIPCGYCGAIDQWKMEEIFEPFHCSVISCTNCGKSDSGFFIEEVDTKSEKTDL